MELQSYEKFEYTYKQFNGYSISKIVDELNKLGVEFSRYKDRWDKLSRSIETVNKDIESIHVTTDKITKRFDSISRVEIKNNNEIE